MVNKSEKKKYSKIWATGKYLQSPAGSWVIDRILASNPTGKVLDIGCGNGYVVAKLLEKNIDAYGIDITKAAWETKSEINPNFSTPKNRLVEASASSIPFGDGEFNTTFSIMLLEHIPPEEISAVIREVLRVSKNKTIHYVNTMHRQRQFGYDLHLMVEPLRWWQAQFNKYNPKGIVTVLKDCNDRT